MVGSQPQRLAPSCPQCRKPLTAELRATGPTRCNGCSAEVEFTFFPAMAAAPAAAEKAAPVLGSEEASCFYHLKNQAVIACDACGRFLCSLCHLELAGQHLCPSCLESGSRKGKLADIENQRTLFDSVALSLAALPLLLWPATVITAPAAIFVAISRWKAPGSLTRRTKIRFVLAILLGLAQIAGWCALAWILIFHRV